MCIVQGHILAWVSHHPKVVWSVTQSLYSPWLKCIMWGNWAGKNWEQAQWNGPSTSLFLLVKGPSSTSLGHWNTTIFAPILWSNSLTSSQTLGILGFVVSFNPPPTRGFLDRFLLFIGLLFPCWIVWLLLGCYWLCLVLHVGQSTLPPWCSLSLAKVDFLFLS